MLSVRVLGPFEVSIDGVPTALSGLRARALVARLAIAAGGVVSVDTIIDEVWGPEAPANPLNALQARVSQIRRELGAGTVRATRPGYALDVRPADVDALTAEAGISEARRLAGTDPERASAGLGRALALWRGEPFGGLGGAPFATVMAARWDEMRLGALQTRFALELAAGRAAASLADLESLASAHPLREPFHELLMRAYSALGRQADALGVYRRIRDRLVDELGIDPGPALSALEVGVLRQETALVGRSDDADAGRTHVGNLPRPLTRLIERGADLAGVQRLLAERRLVTITGPAGVGKTRLAIEVGALAERPRDGVWFVGLEGVDRTESVPGAIAAAIGSSLTERLAGVRARLQGAVALVVIDNCEHLGDAPALAAADLLRDCPGIVVLATSQRPLGLSGEAVWPLDPLPVAAARELFETRLREANPRYVFDTEAHRSAERVCLALDGLPLAIELAARRCTVFTIDELADRLHDRFALLSDSRLDRAERHHTLAAAIGWSYDLLFPDTQQLLQIVSAFPDGAGMSAIEDVAIAAGLPRDEIVELVGQLVDRSLLVADRTGSTSRYRLLHSVRAFAADRVPQPESLRELHARWVVRFSRDVFRGLRGSDQTGWLDALRVERANVEAAFEWLVVHDPGAALALANNLFLGWLICGDRLGGAARLDRAATAAATTATPMAVAMTRACQAVLLARSGRAVEAVPIATDALAALQGGKPVVVAHARSMTGQVHVYAGLIEQGVELIEQARAELAAGGDSWAEAICLFNLALAAGRIGDYVAQERLTHEALTVLGGRDDPFTTHLAFRNLGLVQLRRSAPADALDSFVQALVAEHKIGFADEEAVTLRHIARVHLIVGDDQAALDALATSASISRRLGDRVGIDVVGAELAAVHRARGELDTAHQALDDDRPERTRVAIQEPTAVHIQRGALALTRGDERGRATVGRALAAATAAGDDRLRVLALDVLARFAATPAETAVAEADRLALVAGVHPNERPDRSLVDAVVRVGE